MNLDEFIAIVWRLLAVGALVAVNGFFVAAEFALVKIRDTQLSPLIERGHRRARIARRVLKNLDRSLSAAQVGITLASLGLGWIGEPVFAAILKPAYQWLTITSATAQHSISFIVGFTAITFLHISVGEQAPKWMAIQRSLPTALWVAWPLDLFHRVAYPFIWLLNWSSLWVLRQFGIKAVSEAEAHSEDELRLLLSTAQRHMGATSLGREIVLNALDLRRRVAREVMRPRHEIVGFNTDACIDECIVIAERTRFSRFPLLEHGNFDRTRGFIHIKDLYAARHTARTAGDMVPLSKPIVFVPETTRLERLLEFFLQRRVHLALVVDEYGGTVGLATLENVLEEVVGQIQDEFDQEKPLLTKTGEQAWAVDGSLPLHELADVIGDLPAGEDVTTASGWITQKLGGFPKTGDVVQIENFELQVEEMDGPKVARLTLRKVQESSPKPGS